MTESSVFKCARGVGTGSVCCLCAAVAALLGLRGAWKLTEWALSEVVLQPCRACNFADLAA
jgi:hypothetical protein